MKYLPDVSTGCTYQIEIMWQVSLVIDIEVAKWGWVTSQNG